MARQLQARRQRSTDIKGADLRPSASTQQEFSADVGKVVQQMIDEVSAELLAAMGAVAPSQFATFSDRVAKEEGWPLAPVTARDDDVMDEAFSSLMLRLLNKMEKKFTSVFGAMAKPVTDRMVNRTFKNTETGVKKSLQEVSKNFTIDAKTIPPQVNQFMGDAVAESVALIKRVPSKYFDDIKTAVHDSITSGNGMADLVPALEKHNVGVKNWAHNVAMDQTRKAYNGVAKARMQAAGVRKFEWVHSGGSSQPRHFHQARFPAGLNGGIYSFDDLPVIDEATGEKGIPGQLPYCRCTMRPVISFDTEGDDDANK